jgi:hypothetical protein
MGVAQKIVDDLNQGVSQEELARKYPWNSLSKDDSNILFTIALRLGDNERSYTLLVYLFNVSYGKDLWFSTEVLSQTLQHTLMTVLDRQAILPTMRNQLDQLKEQINAKVTLPERLNKYWLMEATYYSVKGNQLAENGSRGEAVQNYQIAQSIFEQLGLLKQVAEYKTLVRRLLSLSAYQSPLPKTSPIRLRMAQTEPLSPETLSKAGLQSIGIPSETILPTPQDPSNGAVGDENPKDSAQESLPAAAASDDTTTRPIEEPAAAEHANATQMLTTPPETAAPANPKMPAAEEARPENVPISGIYYPLPDVWLENGQLHILGIQEFKGDEAQEQAEQIRLQCEILIGLQLQIKMYHVRRSMLSEEMKLLEKKAQALKEKIERQEKKLAKTETEG